MNEAIIMALCNIDFPYLQLTLKKARLTIFVSGTNRKPSISTTSVIKTVQESVIILLGVQSGTACRQRQSQKLS